ncbi:MAG: riboflavin synthase [Planctomycetota bacterium]
MFTGLVESTSVIRRREPLGTGIRLWIATPPSPWTAHRGQSIAVSGACLTVANDPDLSSEPDLLFELSAETLACTWFGEARVGTRVNVERALQLGDRLDGHLVAGHVDGTGSVCAVDDCGDGGRRVTLEVPAALERYLVEKGSITIDGVSLTVVAPRARRFDVALIPLTLEKTTLGELHPGRVVHIEADMIGKWIERLSAPRTAR